MKLRSKISRHDEGIIFGKDVAISADAVSALPIGSRKSVAVSFV